MQNKRGKFIVLEGIDSCGKDTQQDLLEEYFRTTAQEFVYVRVLDKKKEKTHRLRNIIFNKDFHYENKAEIFLFYADKVEMMRDIKEALDAGKNVICNRWEMSQYAYQIYGKQKEEFRELTDFLTEDLQTKNLGGTYKPDLYILFDIRPEESSRRKFARTEATGKFEDYYDNAKKDFFERVIAGYKEELKKFNHAIINGEQTKEEVFRDTLEAIEKVLVK